MSYGLNFDPSRQREENAFSFEVLLWITKEKFQGNSEELRAAANEIKAGVIDLLVNTNGQEITGTFGEGTESRPDELCFKFIFSGKNIEPGVIEEIKVQLMLVFYIAFNRLSSKLKGNDGSAN